MAYHYDDNALEFWDITIGGMLYPPARGYLYEKPTPGTVKARIHIPRMEPYPEFSRLNEHFYLGATCANRKKMVRIVAEYKGMTHEPDGGVTLELLLYRKGHEPRGVRLFPW